MHTSRRAVWAWAFFDWANSAFSLVVTTTFFPLLMKDYWAAGTPAAQSTLYVGLANTISGLALAVLAPVLGAIADQGGLKLRFLALFTVLGGLATVLLARVDGGNAGLAAVLFGIAAIGFSGNTMFCDALLPDVAAPAHYHRASALAFGLGYLGSAGLLCACVWIFRSPRTFGLADTAAAGRVALGLTAAWWLAFTLPGLRWVRERPRPAPGAGGHGSTLTRGFRQLAATFRELRSQHRLLYFLGGYLLYIDGVNTVIRMATDFGKSLGIPDPTLLLAILVTQLVGVPAAIGFGRIGERIGPHRAIIIGVAAYAAVTLYAPRIRTGAEFMVLAVVIGLVQGGVQSLSRSYFAELIPPGKGGEYFGFYNIIGKSATIVGPTLMGVTALLVGSQRSILSLLLLFAAGLWLLARSAAGRN